MDVEIGIEAAGLVGIGEGRDVLGLGRGADGGVGDATGPGKAGGIALVRELDAQVAGERLDAAQDAVDGDPVAAVRDHVVKSERAHLALRQAVCAAGRDGEEMALRAELLDCRAGVVGHVALTAARHERAVDVKKEELALHTAPPRWCDRLPELVIKHRLS